MGLAARWNRILTSSPSTEPFASAELKLFPPNTPPPQNGCETDCWFGGGCLAAGDTCRGPWTYGPLCCTKAKGPALGDGGQNLSRHPQLSRSLHQNSLGYTAEPGLSTRNVILRAWFTVSGHVSAKCVDLNVGQDAYSRILGLRGIGKGCMDILNVPCLSCLLPASLKAGTAPFYSFRGGGFGRVVYY